MSVKASDTSSNRLPVQFWLLWSGNFINRAGGFINFIFAFYLSTRLSYSSSFVGLVVGLLSAAAAGGALLGGQLADRWGRRPTLLSSQLATAMAVVLLSLSETKILIVVATILVGLFQGMARPAYSAMIADVVPPTSRMAAFSLTYWGNNLAAACAASIGGLAASLGYQVAFLADAATTTLATILIAVGFRRVSSAAIDDVTQKETLPTAHGPWRDRIFLTYCMAAFGLSMVAAQYMLALPLAVKQAGYTPATFGLLITVNTVMIAVGQPLLARWLKDYEPSVLLAVGSVLMGCGFGLTAFAGSAPGFTLTIVVWTIGEMMQSGPSGLLAAGLCPANQRGRYQAAVSLFISAGMFVATIGAGLLINHVGPDAVWLACVVLGLVCATVHLIDRHARRERLAAYGAA